MVTEVRYGTAGLAVGDRVFGLTDWHRDGAAAEYVAVEARNLARLPESLSFTDAAEDATDAVDLIFDTIGGDLLARSASRIKPGGALVSITAPPPVEPADGRAVFFIVEPNRDQLTELAGRAESGRLRAHVGAVYPLAETREAFQAKNKGIPGKAVLEI